MGSQSVRHDWVTDLNWINFFYSILNTQLKYNVHSTSWSLCGHTKYLSVYMVVVVVWLLSCVQLLWPFRLLFPWDFPSKNTDMGISMGIFLTQGSNSCLLHLGRVFTSKPPRKPHQLIIAQSHLLFPFIVVLHNSQWSGIHHQLFTCCIVHLIALSYWNMFYMII